MESWQTTALITLFGSMAPAVIGMILPRRGTVKFGMMIYKGLGMAFGQKRATQIGIPANVWGNLLLMVRTTFTDLSFGVYIASREDFTDECRDHKIEDYLGMHNNIRDVPPQDGKA